MKPCALPKLDFLTSGYNKCIALVRKSSFSTAQGFMKPAPDRRTTALCWLTDSPSRLFFLLIEIIAASSMA